MMSERTLSSDADDPITKKDLDEWGKMLKARIKTDLLHRDLAVAATVFLSIVGLAWYASAWRTQLDQRTLLMEIRVQAMDLSGGQFGRAQTRTLDSLLIELRHMPERIVQRLDDLGELRQGSPGR